jgi:hypothetical protein
MTMLEKLLIEIRQGGTLDTRKLAMQMNTSTQMVEAMLEHLRTRGILRTYESCGDACDGCGLRQSCSSQKSDKPQLWQYVQPQKQA